MRVEAILDGAQSYLHDASESVWSRDELLRLANDGYRQFIAEALPTVRVYQLDVPARDTGAGTQEWEDQAVNGNFAHFTHAAQSLAFQSTYLWEAEMLSGANTPQNSYDCTTHDWERSYCENNVDNHFRFVLAKTHERPRYAFWGDKKLGSRAVTELDLRDQRWWVESGEPIIYIGGNGRELSFEIFEVETTYTQAYFLQEYHEGLPRHFSSDATAARTYTVSSVTDRWDYAYSSGEDNLSIRGLGYRFTTLDETDDYLYVFSWEEDFSTDEDADDAYVFTHWWEIEYTGSDALFLGVGAGRGMESEDRQYVPMAYDSGRQNYGIARDFHSSDSSISIYEHTVPVRSLDEDDIPELIPAQLHKFLKYFIIGKSLSKPGEGYRPDLAQHWMLLFQLGVDFLASLATPSFVDSALARGQVNEVRATTPPRVRLPSTYPTVRRGRA